MDPKTLGKEGEKKAIEFLTRQGYQIIEKNYRKRTGEIDIIAFDPSQSEIVFIEVKTRRSLNFGYPEESVNNKKIKKIIETAEQWLEDKKSSGKEWRIDIISIEWQKEIPTIDHFKNISLNE